MTFQKRKKVYQPKNKKNFSVVNKLLAEEKVNEKFLATLLLLSLEDLIALKLEISAKSAGGSIYGMPLWYSLRDITRDALLKFAISATRTKAEAASFLGISIITLNDYLKKYEVKQYFEGYKNDTT